jgi:phosphoglycolate phosphatase
MLGRVRDRGQAQSILSAAHQGPLLEQVAHFGIASRFDRVFGLSDHYATSKLERGRELIAASGVAPGETLLVGDTEHDFAVGEALGVSVLLVADGHQEYSRLRARTPNALETRYS